MNMYALYFKGPDLEKALKESLEMFEGAGARPSARKVLVMIMDKKSGVPASLIDDAANGLYDNNVKVIPVAVGKEADVKELEKSTKDKNNLIEAPKDFVPDKLGDTIMRKVLKGMKRMLVTRQCNTMQCKCNAMQCHASAMQMQFNVMQYNAIQCSTIQCNSIQQNTMQYNAT